ncbi:E3 ubiquitin/ISG15 ligase TRIM25 isoform X1 [Amia ocellicauda]|uniref:E3 ubiquitin/ISG15 ligase TRIM25 isoform X1 n=1 Tax=Amia ocellicauda TaxID=2972642 RepID=UPI00346493AC
MAEQPSSLLGLEEELTCSICLGLFDSPVTTPCGHNFCTNCLEMTWQEYQEVALGFNCPQCRTHFYTKPMLQKNTVLSTVVKTFLASQKNSTSAPVSECILPKEVEPAEEPSVEESILCDTCMVSQASKTCLTCMASYCETHVRPHVENPVFTAHQLSEPLSDLQERICPEHHKLMEFYCQQHGRCICSMCLQQTHKPCRFSTPQEVRTEQESKLKKNVVLLDEKIELTRSVISQVKAQQDAVKELAASRKRAMQEKYRLARELLAQDEQDALKVVDLEQESAQTRVKTLLLRLGRNLEEMSSARQRIDSLLAHSHSVSFLQAPTELPEVVKFAPYVPRTNINSKQVISVDAAATALSGFLGNLFRQPVDKRVVLLQPGPPPPSQPHPPSHLHPEPVPAAILNPGKIPGKKKNPGYSPNSTKTPPKSDKTPKASRLGSAVNPVQPTDNALKDPPPVCGSPNPVAKRSDLLQCATVLTLDPKTAHKRILLSEDLTKASVSEEQTSYPENPARFSVCSQVLCGKGFSRGRHYWEVKMSSNNFCAVGLAYNSIERKGPTSKLGRNKQSWCVEWFNVKLSAWHDNQETVLFNPSPSRVGILLDCDGGSVTFYNVKDRAIPFHSFSGPFLEAIYPAFWIFSSGTTVTLLDHQRCPEMSPATSLLAVKHSSAPVTRHGTGQRKPWRPQAASLSP